MAFQLESKVIKWLSNLQVIGQSDYKQTSTSSYEIKEATANLFENGTKVAQIVQEIYKKAGLPIPQSLSHLKVSNQTAAQLYNWNILNEALKKIDFQVDPQTKNMIINGDRFHLAFILRKLNDLYNKDHDQFEDSLETQEFKKGNRQQKQIRQKPDPLRESLSLSKSEEQPAFTPIGKKNIQQLSQLEKIKKIEAPKNNLKSQSENDLLEYVIQQLMSCINLNRKQAIALLSDNNKYLAHVFVKGVKGQFTQIEQLLQRWFKRTDFVVQRMSEQNDMCFFFLQVVKPTLLSKSEQVAQWGCRILSKIAHQLANRDLLPLAYDWFVRQAGGLATTALALGRHPKLNQHVVGFILEFARFNVAELFTVELKKVTSNDQVGYIKFMLLIFDPLVDSQLSAQELLSSGAIDYWIEACLKGVEGSQQQSVELKLYCIQFLTKLWRAYPLHIEETLDKVNDIMGHIKKGIRQSSEVARYTLLQLLFNLLDEFASKRNPYASIVYKKLTFLFIENHEELNVRQFMLRNFAHIISKYQSIPIEVFLEPFVKQVKIRQSKSYFLNIFDMEFIAVLVTHRKLKPQVALELFDLLAKTKLNNYEFAPLAGKAMDTLLDRFIHEDIFFQYTSKLVKISLAIFYANYKQKKNQRVMNDQERLLAQKRAEIVNFIISLIQRGSQDLNQRIKQYVIHLKLQIQRKLNRVHKGIQRILEMFPNVERDVANAIQKANNRQEVESNMTSHNSKDGLFPKLQAKYLSRDRDEVVSQQSNQSQGTQYSKATSKQQFPQKDYTKYEQQDERKFLKQNNIGFKRKNIAKRVVLDKQIDPKVQAQLNKAKLRKQQQQKRKQQNKLQIQKNKQALKKKIQKQLQQRNLMQGIKGIQKDVDVRVLFQQNQINQKLLQDDQLHKNIVLLQQQNRDYQSIKLIIKKYNSFLKKLFNKYSSSKINKKDYFNQENENMNQIDLIKLCKEKGLEKNKQTIIDLLKPIIDKNTNTITPQNFNKFIQSLTVYLFLKQKWSTHIPMGDLLKGLLKKMAIGQNFKLEEDQDQTAKNLTEKVRYNPHIELPDNYKKIYERTYEPKKECSYPIKKAIKNDSFITCYQVVNELLFNIFKFQTLQQQVRFFEQARVIKKANVILPPRPKKQRQQQIQLLQDKQTGPGLKRRVASTLNKPVVNRPETNASAQRQKQNSKPKAKVLNAIEKKKLQQQQAKRLNKQKQAEQFKRRQQQTKKRFQKMQQQKQKQKSKQKQQTKNTRSEQQQKKKRQKEQKQKYNRQQKQKLQKYNRQKQQRQKQQKEKQKQLKLKQQQQRRQKHKAMMKREEQKRKQQNEKMKRQRQLSQQKNRKKAQQQQKRKENLKKQVMKKLQGQKQKYQIQKLFKQLLKKVFQQNDIQGIFNDYKEQLKSLYNYGKQFNQYKLGQTQTGLEQKGWMSICQSFNLCDNLTANNLLKQNQKQKGRSGFLYQQFLQNLFNLAVRKQIQNDLQDYDKAHKQCGLKLEKYVKNLKIPKDKLSMKDYFVNLKNNMKKRQQVQVTAPSGQKQTWQIQQK